MAKESFYFSHDFGARNDPKLQKVSIKLGHEGKSVFWDLIEMIYEEGGNLLIAEIDTYAYALRTSPECIKSLINDFGLFNKNRIKFWSESVNERLKQRKTKSEKARESAMNRWKKDANASNNDAMAMQQQVNRNAIKERKGKENKVKESIYSDFVFFDIDFEMVWDNFKKMRIKIKKPMTIEAERLNLIELEKLCKGDKDLSIKIVNKSIERGWQSFFKLNENNELFKNQNQTVYTEPVKRKAS